MKWTDGGGERVFLAADALYLGDEGVGVEFGQGLQLVGGLFDGVFDAEPRHRVR